MENLPLKPDDITFIGVLNACSHAGLVDQGFKCFESMKNVWKLEPKVQHYGCMVDILGRAGRLEDAWKMIEEMPVLPNDVIWRSLQSACRNHGDHLMGQKVAEASMQGGFCDSSSYVLFSNVYAGKGLWGKVSRVRMIMRQRDMRKIPGCSWIELGGVVHECWGDIALLDRIRTPEKEKEFRKSQQHKHKQETTEHRGFTWKPLREKTTAQQQRIH